MSFYHLRYFLLVTGVLMSLSWVLAQAPIDSRKLSIDRIYSGEFRADRAPSIKLKINQSRLKASPFLQIEAKSYSSLTLVAFGDQILRGIIGYMI